MQAAADYVAALLLAAMFLLLHLQIAQIVSQAIEGSMRRLLFRPGDRFFIRSFFAFCKELSRCVTAKTAPAGASPPWLRPKVRVSRYKRLARNRGLLEPGREGLAERRASFAAELRAVIRRVEAIAALAASRRAGLIA